jgi:hypothetical protein
VVVVAHLIEQSYYDLKSSASNDLGDYTYRGIMYSGEEREIEEGGRRMW